MSRRGLPARDATMVATLRPGVDAAIAGAALTFASVLMTWEFACAVPLAAFAAIAARELPLGAGVAAMLAVWATNQALGFACLHYPWDAASLEWGVGLGVIGLASLAAARAALPGRTLAAFAAAFVAYEGLILVGCVASGPCAGAFAPRVIERVFAINAASFGVLIAMATWGASVRWGGPAGPVRAA